MKLLFMKILSLALVKLCDLQHIVLTDAQDERLQGFFIEVIGYHCPLATWSDRIDDKYNLGVWK